MTQQEIEQMYQKRLDALSSDDDEIEILYTDAERDDVTFYGKKDEAIHRWYLLTAAYAPALVRRCLAEFEDDGGVGTVLDPFSGTGTTVLESKKQGFDAIGVEFNPVYKEVATAKTTWDTDVSELESLKEDIFDRAESLKSEWEGVPIEDEAFEEQLGVRLPQIYNRSRWWHDYVLRDLVSIREALNEIEMTDEERRFFRVSILSILVEVSNATYNHVSLSYMDEPPEDVDTFGTLDEQVDEMVEDLREVAEIENPGDVEVRRGDSTKITEYVDENEVDTVITSPPYPNRYSYMRETRPHMFFFEMVDDAGEVGDMALDSIGGTWGRATSQLEKEEIEPENELIESLVLDIANEIHEEDPRMKNYVLKYFNKIERHLQGIETVVSDEGKLAYTVGNSKLKGVEVPTDEILAEMFRAHGFKNVLITRERKRNSKSGLYEAIVFGKRS
jgi:hypothetical protein